MKFMTAVGLVNFSTAKILALKKWSSEPTETFFILFLIPTKNKKSKSTNFVARQNKVKPLQ